MKTSGWVRLVGVAGIALACAGSHGNGLRTDEVTLEAAQEVLPSGSASGLESLLVSLNGLQLGSRAELSSELQRTEMEFSQHGDVDNRLKLAWLLARPGSGFQDEERAAALLSEYFLSADAESGYAAFARLFHDLLQARAVQEAISSRAKADLAAERERAAALRKQISTLQDVLETLQMQFEALKDIETSLSARPSPETELLSNDDGDTEDSTGR